MAIITYNEECMIERTLSAIYDIADEIVIVDSFSTDDTMFIIQKFPKVKLLQREFKSYGNQKNYTIEQCTKDWILFIDADETLDLQAVQSVKWIIENKNSNDAYKIAFKEIFWGKELSFSKYYRIRLFKKNKGKFTDELIHEKVQMESHQKIGIIPGFIKHDSFRNLDYHIKKINMYSSKMAQKRFERGKKATVFHIIFSPIYRFFVFYFFKLSFLDGLGGLYMAASESFYTYLKYMKLYELQNKK